MERFWPRNEKFQIGTIIKTTSDNGSDDWCNAGKRSWNKNGIVIDRSDAHGLCYEIVHDDGSIAWYEPEELEVIR